MADDPGSLILLHEAGNPTEANWMKSLLEAQSIDCIIQGELHASMLAGFASGVIIPRLMVRQGDLERARQVLASSAVLEGTQPQEGVVSLEGAVCPVHEQSAVATCDRCGTFLCASCPSLGSPPLCEDCLAVDDRGPARGEGARKALAYGYLIPLGLAAVAVVLVWLLRTFG